MTPYCSGNKVQECVTRKGTSSCKGDKRARDKTNGKMGPEGCRLQGGRCHSDLEVTNCDVESQVARFLVTGPFFASTLRPDFDLVTTS